MKPQEFRFILQEDLEHIMCSSDLIGEDTDGDKAAIILTESCLINVIAFLSQNNIVETGLITGLRNELVSIQSKKDTTK